MKSKLIIIFLLISSSLAAQSSEEYETFMSAVKNNNPTAQALLKKLDADKIGNRTGIAPNDPEAEIAYFPKRDVTFELNVTQSLEFPTVYTNRSKISHLKNDKSEVVYLEELRKVLDDARETFFEAIYYNRKLSLVEKSRSNAKKLMKLYEKRVKSGDATKLEKNKINALMLDISTQHRKAVSGRENCINKLKMLTNSTFTSVNDTIYPLFDFGDKTDFKDAALAANYQLKINNIDTLIAQRNLKLSRAQWMPGFKVGYKLTMNGGYGSNGFIAGLTIPLWKNSNRIKHAKLNIEATKAQNESVNKAINTEISNLYTSYSSLLSSLKEYYDFKDNTNTLEIINKAVEYGEISMLEYFVELNIWYDIEDNIIELEREYAITSAKMKGLLGQ